MMPELDGLGLCREVRSAQRDGSYVYILLLTSRQDAEDVVAGLEAGADDYITKPFHPAVLRARLHTGCRILSLEEKLVRAREEMRFKATHDALTSLWNRGSILSMARSELHRCAREARPFSVLLCDLDHFKRVNDKHGHLAGDAVLEEVARRLNSLVRDYDAVGRYGGEEFLIVLSNCDEDSLRTRAEEIRSAIASSPIQTGTAEVSVSISIGAMTHCCSDRDFPMESILAKADAALYVAKEAGRNRAVFADPRIAA
jgi:two-component system, cell cycle response regulator